MGITEPMRAYSASTGAPLAGLTPTFLEYKRELNGSETDLFSARPSFVDKGNGRYEFTTLAGQALIGSTINYLVDFGATAAPQYQSGSIDGNELLAATSETGLASNALTTLANVKEALGIVSTSQDSMLARLINSASDAAERYCQRRFGYRAGIIEAVPGYGTNLIHVDRMPIWRVTAVAEFGTTVDSTFYAVKEAEAGSIYNSQGGWANTAPIALTASPHFLAGAEDKQIVVTYDGGYALPSANRIASNVPAWLATTHYSVGDLVTADDSAYVATVAGTSGSSGPSGMASSITDGSVTWQYVGPAFPLPYALEQAVIELTVYMYRRTGRDFGVLSETLGRASRMSVGKIAGPDGIPQAIAEKLDFYRGAR